MLMSSQKYFETLEPDWPGYLTDEPCPPPRDKQLFDPDRQPIKLLNGKCCPTCELDSLIMGGTRKMRDGSRKREYICMVCHRHTVIPLLKYIRKEEKCYINYVFSEKYNCYVYDLVESPKEVKK